MTNFDDMKLSVEALSGGKNTVKLDDLGMPSVVVPFPKLKYSDVLTGGTQNTLPAFIVDGQEKAVLYISKYQNFIVNDRAYSLPMKDPSTSITYNRTLQVCLNKGAGWHLLTNALWAAIALWCKKNNTQPHGNNNYGEDIESAHEKGIPAHMSDATRIGRCATGSGPATWYHNYSESGIADLNGNVWERVGGMRLNNGEIQIIPYGNAMKIDCDMGESSTEWKAIMPDETLVSPGTAGTLKWDYAAGKITLSTTLTTHANANRKNSFETIASASGITAPMLLKALGLHPNDALGYGGNSISMNNSGERLPLRGGRWYSAADAGVFTLDFSGLRTGTSTGDGFRSAFYE